MIDNRDDFNDLPDRRAMASAPTYWNWVGQILSGVGGHPEPPDRRIEQLRKNAAAYEAQRPSVIAEIVAEAVDVAREAVSSAFARVPIPGKAKAKTEIARATEWLIVALAGQVGGQLGAVEVERLAKEAGISMRTLRRASKVAGIKHVRNPDKTWSWRLIRARPKAGGKV